MPTLEIEFPSGIIKAFVTSARSRPPTRNPGLLAVHRCLGEAKGYVVTHVPTLRCVLRTKLQGEAKEAARALEDMDWSGDLAAVRRRVMEIRSGK